MALLHIAHFAMVEPLNVETHQHANEKKEIKIGRKKGK